MYLSSYNNGIVYFSGRLEDLRGEIDFSLCYEIVFASQVNNFISIFIFLLILKSLLILTY